MSTRIEREGGGYFTCPNRWFDAGYANQVPATITSVYMFLCRWEGRHMENESSQPIPTIARQVGCSPDVARDAVRVLEEWEVLHRTPARGPKGENVWLLKALQKIAPKTPYQPKKGRKTTPHKKNQGSEKNHGEKNQAYQPDVNQPVSSDKSSDTYSSDSYESSLVSDHTDLADEEHSHNTVAEELPVAKSHSAEDLFSEFWSSYPKTVAGRSNRKSSLAKFKLALKKSSFEEIMAGLEWFKNSPDWLKEDGRWVPGAQAWLNGERWLDADVANQPPAASKPPQQSPEEMEDLFAQKRRYIEERRRRLLGEDGDQ